MQADDNIADQKKMLRKQAAATRKIAADTSPNASELLATSEIYGQIMQPNVPRLVAGYWPIRTEIDPVPLMQALKRNGSGLCLPSTPQEGLPLRFHSWSGDPDELGDGPYGTRQPDPMLPEVLPDLVLAPLLAFDKACWRLGYGGGFYDRTLAAFDRLNHRAKIIGLAYAQQMVDSVPTGIYDRQLNGIMTEQGLFLPDKGL